MLENILKEADVQAAIEKHAEEIDEFFTQAVQVEFEKAHSENNLERMEKIQKVVSILDKMTAPPPEVVLIQKLLDASDDETRKKILQENETLVNDHLLQTINAIITESSTKSQAPELIDTLKSIYKMALRAHMEKNLKS